MLDVNAEVRVQTPLLGQQPLTEVVRNGDDGERKTDELGIAFRPRRGLGSVEKRALDTDADPFVARPIKQVPLSRDVLLKRESGRNTFRTRLRSTTQRRHWIIARADPEKTSRRSRRSFLRRNRNDFSALRAPLDLSSCHNPLHIYCLTNIQ